MKYESGESEVYMIQTWHKNLHIVKVCKVLKDSQCIPREELMLTTHKSCDMMDTKSFLDLLSFCVCACSAHDLRVSWCAANPREIRKTQTRSDRHPLCAIRRGPMNEHPCKESSKRTTLL